MNIDNLDLASQTSRIKDSRKLCDLIFNIRNTDRFKYDESIIELISADKKYDKELYVLKLRGQHYPYYSNYPEYYDRFSKEDYQKEVLQPWMRQSIAEYDNATLYNDYVVASLIDLFKDDNAVVLYFLIMERRSLMRVSIWGMVAQAHFLVIR